MSDWKEIAKEFGCDEDDIAFMEKNHIRPRMMCDEITRLRRVITKELTENDELGCEYTYVNALKEETVRLQRENQALTNMLGLWVAGIQDVAPDGIKKLMEDTTRLRDELRIEKAKTAELATTFTAFKQLLERCQGRLDGHRKEDDLWIEINEAVKTFEKRLEPK